MKAFIIFLFAVFFQWNVEAQDNHEMQGAEFSHKKTPAVRGLEGIASLDAWVKTFKASSSPQKLNPQARTALETFISEQGRQLTANELYQFVLGRFRGPYQNPEAIENLARAFFEIREKLRPNTEGRATKENWQIITLLSHLAEETLSVASAQRKRKPFIFEVRNSSAPRSSTPTRPLNGIELQSGDVLLSKGGAGSSAFISRISDSGGNFSHATLAYINPKGELFFPESEIEDGTKLRSPKKDYVDNKKVKLFVYRFQETKPDSHTSAKAADTLVEEMTSILKAQGKNETHLTTDSAYPYDFSMDASESKNIFCSELVMRAYELAGARKSNEGNPYSENTWSQIADPSLKEFFSSFLGVQSHTFPAPSDMERNGQFKLVALQIDTSKLHTDRIDVATIDTLIWLLNRDPIKSKKFLDLFKDHGNEVVKPEKLKIFVEAKLISEQSFQKIIKKVPANITLKQLVFFAFLNEKLMPEIRKAVTKTYPQSEYLGPLELRAHIQSLAETNVNKFVQVLEKIKSND